MLKRLSASPSAALAVTSLLSLVISASGQTTAPSRGSLEGEVAGVKAENAALREQLRNLEEQQKAMLSLMQQLQRRLDGPPVTAAQSAAQPASPAMPESLLTRTWIWSGETVSAGPVVVGDPVAVVVLEGTFVPGSGLSVRIAFQMVSALEVHWTRFGSGA